MTRRSMLTLLSTLGLAPTLAAAASDATAAPGIAPLELSDAEWRKRLTPAQFNLRTAVDEARKPGSSALVRVW